MAGSLGPERDELHQLGRTLSNDDHDDYDDHNHNGDSDDSRYLLFFARFSNDRIVTTVVDVEKS